MAANPYELQRQRIKTDSAAQGQQQNEALKRRYARMGGLNSGSYQKASERLAGQQEQNQQRATEGVDIQESAAEEAKAETQRGRDFARGERIGSQEFSAGESALGRRFATSEREGAQGFAAGEAEKGRKFTTSEREGMQSFADLQRQHGQSFADDQRRQGQDFAAGESALTRGQQQGQFDKQMGMAEKQFVLDEDVTRFNQVVSAKMAGINVSNIKQMVADLLRGKRDIPAGRTGATAAAPGTAEGRTPTPPLHYDATYGYGRVR